MTSDRQYRSRVLVIRLSALGDVAILQPVVKARAEANPDVLFIVAAPPMIEPLFQGIGNVVFMGVRKKQSPWRLFCQMMEARPTVVADMHWVNRVVWADMFFVFRGIKVHHIMKDRCGRKALTRRRNKRLVPLKNTWQRYDEVFDACGLEGSDLLSVQSRKYWVPDCGDSTVCRIGIAPFAQHKGKIWPLDNMRRLIDMLAQKPYNEIILFGSKDEAAQLEKWASPHTNVRSMAGRQSFDKELEIIASLHIMVSMDSANMHFASCLGIPVVSLWGATHPIGGFYGWRQNPEWCIQEDLPCRPCSMYGQKQCIFGDYRCLSSITPTHVVQKIERIIAKKS
ncbi:MAG: glycosyltransferase family 9 protein [Bacteroidales bacterium]|nr:glycosyltransferase family 9 protein [Bacteroidales bacterium]